MTKAHAKFKPNRLNSRIALPRECIQFFTVRLGAGFGRTWGGDSSGVFCSYLNTTFLAATVATATTKVTASTAATAVTAFMAATAAQQPWQHDTAAWHPAGLTRPAWDGRVHRTVHDQQGNARSQICCHG